MVSRVSANCCGATCGISRGLGGAGHILRKMKSLATHFGFAWLRSVGSVQLFSSVLSPNTKNQGCFPTT